MANLMYENLRIYKNVQLNSEDYRSLTLLYLPLIGIDSFAAYSVLNSLQVDEIITYKRIMDLLNFYNIKLLIQALDKLEGIGLLKTYFSESKGYAYEVIKPLCFDSFFNSEVLSGLLKTTIGDLEFDKLFVSKSNKVYGYKQISKKFSDVFVTTSRSANHFVSKLLLDNIQIENKDFNYTLFKILFDNTLLSEDVLNNKEFKEKIEKISFTYHLNEEEMKEVIVRTIDIDKSMEFKDISKNARLKFSQKNDGFTPRIETIEKDNFIPSQMDDEVRELLVKVENSSISDTLYSISGIKPSVSEINQFEKLQENTGFSNGVINLMILYVNKQKNGELPHYNYFEKIANVWSRAKVKNAYDVLKYLQDKDTVNNTETKKQTSKTKTSKKNPSWYDEYTKNFDEKYNKDDIISEDPEMEILIKDLFD